MATFNIYHGFPAFNPGAVFVDALLNGSIISSDPSNVLFMAPDGATIDFTGSFVPGTLPPTGTVTGIEVFASGLTTQPPLITATGYDFDLDTALFPD